MAEAIDYLLSKHMALNSNPSTAKTWSGGRTWTGTGRGRELVRLMQR
jgi:hypothetical protein